MAQIEILNPLKGPGQPLYLPLHQILQCIVDKLSRNESQSDIVCNASSITHSATHSIHISSQGSLNLCSTNGAPLNLSSADDIFMCLKDEAMSVKGLLKRLHHLESVVENLVLETRLAIKHKETAEWMFMQAIKEHPRSCLMLDHLTKNLWHILPLSLLLCCLDYTGT